MSGARQTPDTWRRLDGAEMRMADRESPVTEGVAYAAENMRGGQFRLMIDRVVRRVVVDIVQN